MRHNVSGISSVTKFIIENNQACEYIHFTLGKQDSRSRGLTYIISILNSFFRWCLILLNNRHIIVHVNFALEKRAILRDSPFIIAARLLRKNTIIHLHGGVFLMNAAPKWLSSIIKIVLMKKEPKVVLSPLEKDILSKNFNAENIFVLPNCVSLVDKISYKRILTDHRPLCLLFMGRIVESKGIKYIYQACEILKERQIPFTFSLAGTGPDQSEYIDKFNVLLGEQFIYRGVVGGNEKISLIKNSDVFLLPSISGEGLPMALLESMSLGAVPVTTNDGSMSHVVKDRKTGLMVEKYSAKQIALAIEELDNDRHLLKQMGENSQHHIAEYYKPANYIASLNFIYNQHHN